VVKGGGADWYFPGWILLGGSCRLNPWTGQVQADDLSTDAGMNPGGEGHQLRLLNSSPKGP